MLENKVRNPNNPMTMASLLDLTVQSKYFLETIRRWSESQLREWLKDLGIFTQFQLDRFTEHCINGNIFMDLSHATLSDMQINSVGVRMKILIIIKRIREALGDPLKYNLLRSAHSITDLNQTTNAGNLSISTSPSVLQGPPTKKNAETRLPRPSTPRDLIPGPTPLGRQGYSPSEKARNASMQSPVSYESADIPKLEKLTRSSSNPPSPTTATNTFAPKDYSKKRVIRVHYDTQSRTMDISTLTSQSLVALYAKIFAKFNIFRVPSNIPEQEARERIETEMKKWSLLLVERELSRAESDIQKLNDDIGVARLLREDEVQFIGTSASTNPDNIPSLTLRRRRLSKATPNRRPSAGQSPVNMATSVPSNPSRLSSVKQPNLSKLERIFGEEIRDVQFSSESSLRSTLFKSASQPSLNTAGKHSLTPTFKQGQPARGLETFVSSQSNKLMNFFGQRPPSELITGNLTRFFPNVRSPPPATTTLESAIAEERESQEDLRLLQEPANTSDPLIGNLSKSNENEEHGSNSSNEEFEEVETVDVPTETFQSLNRNPSIRSPEKYKDQQQHFGSPTSFVIPPPYLMSPNIPSSPLVAPLSSVSSTVVTPITSPTATLAHRRGKSSLKRSSTHLRKMKWVKGALIGTGSFGSVYLGLNARTGELMAVKQVILPADTTVQSSTKLNNSSSGAIDSDLQTTVSETPMSAPMRENPQALKLRNRRKQMVDALQREISLLKELEHPNIVRYLGSESNEKHLNIFLEYVPGGSLATLAQTYGNFEEALIKTFVGQILTGLGYLHDRNIVHRDIKGANILVDNKGIAKITDFGISKKLAPPGSNERGSMLSLYAGGSSNRSSALQGSVYWMAPEVVKDYNYTKKADIWSFGCLIVEMVTGTHPWPELDQMQAMFKIGSQNPPPYPITVISSELKDFLEQCLALSYIVRPSAEQLMIHPFLSMVQYSQTGSTTSSITETK